MDEKVTKRDIKSQRVKSYFIQAAKQIIIDEGVENISVRKVAENSGYTFASIYNYFKDVNELLHDVKTEMIFDVANYLKNKMPEKIVDINSIKKIHHIYIDYYIERPHVFRFFYSCKLDSEKAKPYDMPNFENDWRTFYYGLVLNGTIKENDVPIVAKTIIYSMHGILALYFSDNGLATEDIYMEVDQIIDYLLKENTRGKRNEGTV